MRRSSKGCRWKGRWRGGYTRLRGSENQLEDYRRQASRLTEGLPDGADVLEVAPGPGYLAIEIARAGRLRVTGLDISRSFVEIAQDNARRAGVSADFRHGDAANMPFESGNFDLVVCQAAFKNFARPVAALDEMHRVLRVGETAVIQDMNRDASGADIRREVQSMGLSLPNALITRWTLAMLRRRAYSPAQFECLAADSAFRTCEIQTEASASEWRCG